MARYSWAELDRWALAMERRTDLIVKQSVNDLIVLASRTRPGMNRGGTVQPGFVPRDKGFLAASLVSQLNGGTVLSGENSYIMVVSNAKGGDVFFFGWTAAYARMQHYKGWLWVDNAAANWGRIVRSAVARAKAISS